MRYLVFFRQDVLEGAISEKDSLIAELEMKGVLSESETMRCDALKSERDKLLNRLKNEVRLKYPDIEYTIEWGIHVFCLRKYHP